ncbi:hypothetical protein MBM_00685 [Drepanopeziza brunnea f. sp. 'multigermtubi' MB_m1]|uniref:Uncharacterized protein n=1 Tax=Marssonina brunnea f. sp. multigermtubi (strain MB_m1) TaxID=1072389 RepID=K1X990_MARBU|nr:uncharacterized protein MBM_00685 [Drepanopeziza brunnea f. sp. 'multigermtubi' MB_m1]EKD21572.1 hypothetical protein MBM_00685 [Drepanopeziza brunnea f. sp. 'multigermtubi' MB_m1]
MSRLLELAVNFELSKEEIESIDNLYEPRNVMGIALALVPGSPPPPGAIRVIATDLLPVLVFSTVSLPVPQFLMALLAPIRLAFGGPATPQRNPPPSQYPMSHLA